MMDYIIGIYRAVYDFFNPNAENIRLARFDKAKRLGILEGMCSSEIHALFGIRGESSEF